MEPERKEGDDRVMWMVRPLRPLTADSMARVGCGQWAIVDRASGVIEMVEGGDPDDSSYEVKRATITAAQWNMMPEFEGW